MFRNLKQKLGDSLANSPARNLLPVDLGKEVSALVFFPYYVWYEWWTLRLLDSSPTRLFAYYLDRSPTDCSLFYEQDY